MNIKVVELKDETQVEGGGRVKCVSAADESGMARVSVWEENMNAMEKKSKLLSQEFHGVRVSENKILHDGQGRLRNHLHWGP